MTHAADDPDSEAPTVPVGRHEAGGNGSVLGLTGQYWTVSASNASGKIRLSFPASTNRYYQLVYSTNLASPTLTNQLGWGVSGMAITNNGAGTWFGRIRSLLAAP